MRRRQPTVRFVATVVALLAAAGCAKGAGDASGPTTTAAPTISLSDPTSSTVLADPSGKEVAGQVFGGSSGSEESGAGGGSEGGEVAIGGSSEDAEKLLDDAGEQTAAEITAAFSITMELDGASGQDDTLVLATVTGEYDQADEAVHTVTDMSGMNEYYPGTKASDQELFADPIDTISLGTISYMSSDAFEKMAGSPWIKVDMATQGMAANPLVDLVHDDGMAGLLAWTHTGAPVEERGSEDVDGASTTHFHSEFDPSSIDPDERGTLDRLLANLEDTDHAAVDVWVDDDAHVRRIEIVVDADAIESKAKPAYAGGEITLRIELSSFGEPVTIEAPPAEEVVDMADLEHGTPTTAS